MSDAQNIEALPEWGPKMQALNPRQRAFVMALYADDAPAKGDGRLIWAAHQANYGNSAGTTTNKALSVIANRLVNDDRILAAMREYSRGAADVLKPEAIRAVKYAIRNPKHKDHIRATAMILDRTDPVQVKHEVNVRHEAPTIEMTEQVIARIEALARRAGVAALPAPIEGEFAVVATGEAK